MYRLYTGCMKIALLSDIHGNRFALEALLADITSQGGVDRYWILGDLVALGPDPVGVLERLMALPNIAYVRGNTDRYVVSRDRPPPPPDDVRQDLGLLPILADVAATFAWTQGMVTAAGWFAWLAALPLEVRLTLPDGTGLPGVHAASGCDDGPGDRVRRPHAPIGRSTRRTPARSQSGEREQSAGGGVARQLRAAGGHEHRVSGSAAVGRLRPSAGSGGAGAAQASRCSVDQRAVSQRAIM